MSQPIRLAERRRRQRGVYFDRREINRLLSVYSRQVRRGLWRDYAIDHRPEMAVFSVFRHSFDSPIYRIAKSGGARPAEYRLFAGARLVKAAASLDDVLALFDRKLRLVG